MCRSIRRIRRSFTLRSGKRAKVRGKTAAWNGTNGGIFKSTDGGKTWKQLSKGLPDEIVQANLAIAPSSPQTLVRRRRDAEDGRSFIVPTTAAKPGVSPRTMRVRPAASAAAILPVVRFDPKNPTIVYSASIVCWKSTDGGKTWDGLRGAPGGDDYQNVWINPEQPERSFCSAATRARSSPSTAARPGAPGTTNRPRSFITSAPTTRFLIDLYSGQQESGSVGIASRGNDGAITFRDWHPVAAEEYGYVVADPLDPDIVYGGKLTRYDRRTGQAQNILPKPFRSDDFRMVRTQPVVFSPVDPHLLFFATNTLWQTTRRRPELGADQPGPDAQDLRSPGERRQISRRNRPRNRRSAA